VRVSKVRPKEVVYYDTGQVKVLYAAAKDDEERFTLSYFLTAGIRDGEAAHSEYTDVKGGFPWREDTFADQASPHAADDDEDFFQPLRLACGCLRRLMTIFTAKVRRILALR
jgi:hypothetical protein